mmetsp:Transcript_14118/g.12465  ORF Transcript_14118/g.12465 Transcript_14118/m.12465 type:complete len:131 (+) Transcript_14118:218-610(+)
MLKGELDHFLETEKSMKSSQIKLNNNEETIKEEIAQFDLYEDNNLDLQSEPNTVANSIAARNLSSKPDPHNMVIFDGVLKNNSRTYSKENQTIVENSNDVSCSPRIYMDRIREDVKEEFKSSKGIKYTME